MQDLAIKTEPSKKVVASARKLDFILPVELECATPTEVRGMQRDEVRLMVSNLDTDGIDHVLFKDIDQFLHEGDVLVVNTSGTLKTALEAFTTSGQLIRVHLSTQIEPGQWVIELRQLIDGDTKRFHGATQDDVLALKNGGSIHLIKAYYANSHERHLDLWVAHIDIPIPVESYLDYYGLPIKYKYVKESYPQSYYQTIFAQHMGSAEMPSAGRGFTHELVTRLISKGVQVLPIMLHTGVASLEINEKPYSEYYRVPAITAEAVNLARWQGRRVIAVGTTVVRALEAVTNTHGKTSVGEGWTDVYITPKRGLNAVDGLLTGFHEPRASHLLMLEALAGKQHLLLTYQEALKEKYHWHEFGDLHLMIGERRDTKSD